jgi:hypothetical protein
MQIMISDRGSHAGALAQFFSSNVTPEYISHGELQGYRALDPSRWSPDLESHLRVQIGARLGGAPRRVWRRWSIQKRPAAFAGPKD